LHVAAVIQKQLAMPELKIEWVSVEAATRLEAVATGKVDADCGTTTISLSRMQTVDFSVPIFVDGGGVLVRGKKKPTRMADLKGKRVAVIGGTTTEQGSSAR
jgi:ABC-type amino acid transport substrate-binding protein